MFFWLLSYNFLLQILNESLFVLLRVREAEDINIVELSTKNETRQAKNPTHVKEDTDVDSYVAEPYIDSSNGMAMQEAIEGYSYSKGAEDYNQLLNQYYELEDKKQQILQQLHQFSSLNYQFSGEGCTSGAQWGAFTTQEHPTFASQASYPTVVCSCCLYACQFLVTPCTTYPNCSMDGTCIGKTCTDTNAVAISQKPHSLVNVDIVKTAMGAVERAMASIKTKASANPYIIEDKFGLQMNTIDYLRVLLAQIKNKKKFRFLFARQ